MKLHIIYIWICTYIFTTYIHYYIANYRARYYNLCIAIRTTELRGKIITTYTHACTTIANFSNTTKPYKCRPIAMYNYKYIQ